MEQIPDLSKDQHKRLCEALVKAEYVKSFTAARKATQNKQQQKEVVSYLFCKSFRYSPLLKDIFDLYHLVVETEIKRVRKKLSEPIDKKPLELIDEKITRPVRGKGKKESKVMYPVRLDTGQLERLKQLPGAVSQHIRMAIEAYLTLKQIDKKIEGGED